MRRERPSPEVSVIVPAYNAEKFIRQAIRSVLQQSHHDLELVVVDDGSSDATVDAVGEFDDPRLRLLCGSNQGPSGARNQAISATTGRWIALLDADDFWAPDRLERLLAIAADWDGDMVADDLVILNGREPPGTFFDELRLRLDSPVVVSAPEFIQGRLGGKPTPRAGIIKPLLRRAFLDEKDVRYVDKIRVSEDWLLYCQCLLRGARLVLVPTCSYFYRRLPDSLSLRDPVAVLDQEEQAIRHLAEDPAFPDDLRPSLEQRLYENRRRIAVRRLEQALRAGDRRGTLTTIRDSPAALPLYLQQGLNRARVRFALGRRIARARALVKQRRKARASRT